MVVAFSISLYLNPEYITESIYIYEIGFNVILQFGPPCNFKDWSEKNYE